MEPSVEGLPAQGAHALVCELIQECASRGMRTECTVVEREDVDVELAKSLASRLGASVRVRPYLP